MLGDRHDPHQLDLNDLRPRCIPEDELARRHAIEERNAVDGWAAIAAVAEDLLSRQLADEERAAFQALHLSAMTAAGLPTPPPLRQLASLQRAG